MAKTRIADAFVDLDYDLGKVREDRREWRASVARLTAELASGTFSNKGYAGGGWAGLNGPELAWLGERGPEYVSAAGSGEPPKDAD